MPPKVAIVIPCYNQGIYLEDAVRSALRQTIAVEIIVVDDGSTDAETIDILEKLQSLDIIIHRQANAGLATARNNGITNTKAEYILCLDADDIVNRHYCEKCLRVFRRQTGIGFVYPDIKVFGQVNKSKKSAEFSILHLLIDNYIPYAAIFRRDLWQDVAGYTSTMPFGYEDWDFWLSACERGWQGQYLHEELFWYRKHGRSMLSSANARRQELKQTLMRRHHRLYASRNVVALVKREWRQMPYVIEALGKEMVRTLHFKPTNRKVV